MTEASLPAPIPTRRERDEIHQQDRQHRVIMIALYVALDFCWFSSTQFLVSASSSPRSRPPRKSRLKACGLCRTPCALTITPKPG